MKLSLLPFPVLAVLMIALAPLAEAEPNIDGEEIPAGEADAMTQVAEMVSKSVLSGFYSEGHAYRDAHRKAHGCVQASFTVLGGLPPELAQGVFAEPKDYSAIIRYSNGSGASQDDRTGDGRGMAVKVLGVDGPKILTEDPENSTQDFLMINYPVFFVRNALDYVGFERAQLRGNLGLLWWLGTHILHEGWIATRISLIHFTNPLNSRYWSMTPSKLALKQMKFSAEPCAGSRFEPGVSNSKDLLRENLEAHLAKQSACFDFKVQVRTDPRNMPIEDATIEWSEKAAPFVPVARIVIPVQKPVQGEACEVLSYTPWHTSPELRPLGGIQRVRKAVYQEISNLRHELNGQANPLVSCGASCNGSPGDSSLPTP